jgi:hypothetical protein
MLDTKKGLADGPALRADGPRSGQSAVMAWTVHACAESVRVPSFSRDLLPRTAGLTRKQFEADPDLPLYIDEGLQPIEPPQQSIKSSLFLVFTLFIRSSSSLVLV